MPESPSPQPEKRDAKENCEPIQIVEDSLRTMRFGAILLTVHDGRLVQIDITEKRRFTA